MPPILMFFKSQVPVAGLNEARSKFELSNKYNKETEIYINQYNSKKQ